MGTFDFCLRFEIEFRVVSEINKGTAFTSENYEFSFLASEINKLV